MSSPPPTRRVRASLAVSVALVSAVWFVQVAAAQSTDPGADPGVSLVVQAIAAGAVTLVIGGLFIVAAPEYTERVTDRALTRPGQTFLWGVALFVAVLGSAFVLAITIIGLIVAIPLLFLYVLFALVAGELGYLAAGRLASDDWPIVLLVAIGVAFVVGGVPILGGLIGFILGCIGVGAVVVDYRADEPPGGHDERPAGRERTDTARTEAHFQPSMDEAEPSREANETETWGGESGWNDEGRSDQNGETVGDDRDDGRWGVDGSDDRDVSR